MSSLFAPGDERAGSVMSDAALLRALLDVESVWLAVLVDAGAAPGDAAADPAALVDGNDLPALAREAEQAGNPVPALVRLLRHRLSERSPLAGRWLHRGLTSQDVLDTALTLCLRDAADRILLDIARQAEALSTLADRHRTTVQAGRTLTQHAVPTTFGLCAAVWLGGLLDAADDLATARAALPAQVGGAAGTSAAVVELARVAGHTEPARTAQSAARMLAERLGLAPAPPWHTARRPVTRLGDALVACLDAFGAVAGDVALRSRPELGELTEPAADGRGGSSTMPQKQNPVLSVLVRAQSLAGPSLGATLHTAAAAAVDQRPDGAWHAEWPALRTLARRCATASSLTGELVTGLRVHPERMRATAAAAGEELLAEQRSLRALAEPHGSAGTGTGPTEYLGLSDELIDGARARAHHFLENLS
ncbi:lyase family protein [Streptomyces sp. TR02-1]|uniref:lyase family protein n=1 Tax=Streptomyces sp. TR02-1 TaxID=3385977 RepID=UPI00399F56CF